MNLENNLLRWARPNGILGVLFKRPRSDTCLASLGMRKVCNNLVSPFGVGTGTYTRWTLAEPLRSLVEALSWSSPTQPECVACCWLLRDCCYRPCSVRAQRVRLNRGENVLCLFYAPCYVRGSHYTSCRRRQLP